MPRSGDHKHYELAFRACPVPIIISRLPDGEVIDVNDAFAAEFGVPREDIIGKTTIGLDVWAFASERDRCIATLERDGRAQFDCVTLRRADGTHVRCEFLARMLDSAEHGQDLVTILRDLEPTITTESALRQSEAHLREILDNLQDGYMRSDVSDRIVEANAAAARIYGYDDVNDLLGTPVSDLYAHSDDRPGVLDALVRGGVVRDRVLEGRMKDGGTRWTSLNARQTRDDSGAVIGTEGVVRDISERIAAENALRELTMTHATAESVARIGSWRWDLARLKVSWSDEMFVLFGIDKASFDGDVDEIVRLRVHPDDHDAVMSSNRDVLEHDRVKPLDYRLVMPDGTLRWVHAEGQLVRDKSGNPVALTGYVQDITERRLAEEELAQHQQELERSVVERTAELTEANEQLAKTVAQLEDATKAKSQFLANVSHELRTPLNSIIGFTGIMQQGLVGELSEEQARQIGMVHESGRHLLDLVDDILDLSRIEAGAVGLRPVQFEVAALVVEVGEAVRPLFVQSGLELRYSCDPQLGTMYSDSRYIRRILINLMGNAVKFTNVGGVTLAATPVDETIKFTVTDTGMGIAAEEIEHVFQEFYQVAVPNEAKSRGTGLGLAVSRQLAEALGGDLAVESEPGVGSTFTVTLPAHLS